MPNEGATIITFYSYKGGVGRSMAVANVAWVLAKKFHKRVLVVDWDLEAPGLHRFFDIDDKEVSKGLIDLFNDYKTLVRDEQKSLPDKLVDIRKYIQSVRPFSGGGEISLLPAGKQDKNYATLINEFSWTEFYAKWHGFGLIEYLKNELKNLPDTDIILVDSRTGVTDIGGICTLQLPDIVVLLFSLNDQNITGVKLVAERISEKAVEIEGRERPPALLIRPARVERTGNQDEKVKWQQIAAAVLGEFVTEGNPQVLMAKRNIPYIGDYSYGETPLAFEKDPLGDMAEAFEDLAESILRTAGRVDSSQPRRSSSLAVMKFVTRHLKSLRSWTIAAVGLLLLVMFGLLLALGSKTDQVTALSQALSAKADEAKKTDEELKGVRKQLDALTAGATLDDQLPANWRTSKPNQAWCYQSNYGDTYHIECHSSQSRCESARKRKQALVPQSECDFVKSLNTAGWQPVPFGPLGSWVDYEDKPFGPPFPQLPSATAQ
ncbi:MAG TPA: ParA family protein [Pyrinomonadaceae bacterium]|jgi:MinD-like ATPase involved in chromosome partitioning or flagellar assembly